MSSCVSWCTASCPRCGSGRFRRALAGFVPTAVNVLRRQRAGAVIVVEEGTVNGLPGRLWAGELHVAVTFQDASAPRRELDGLRREDIVSEPFLVALAADHPLASRATVRLADLAGEPWTAASRDGLIVRACRAAGFEPRLVSLTREQFAIRATVMSGAAVTLAPQLLADAFAGTALRPIDGSAPARDVYALVPPGRRHPLVEPLLEALRAIAQQRVRRHKAGE
jgi:DNA-binding transcriptional LysR family regulator